MNCKLLLKGLVPVVCLLILSTSSVMAQDFCKGDFNYNGSVAAEDVETFLEHFGRSPFYNPCPPDGPAPVPKTGVTTSFHTGDDGDLERGVLWPNPRFTIIYYDETIQLCDPQTADCDDDPFTDLVQDNLTGLMWTRNTDSARGVGSWAVALDLIGWFNGFASWGYDDWRVPNITELQSLLNYGVGLAFDPFLPLGHPFVAVKWSVGDEYWSSTPQVTVGYDGAFTVDLLYGETHGRDQTETHYLWIVRGGR